MIYQAEQVLWVIYLAEQVLWVIYQAEQVLLVHKFSFDSCTGVPLIFKFKIFFAL